MEYVEGEPLTTYCDARTLTVTARLELFRQVCAAVQFAHQSLVVHRDIKPANILVTADGTPKLLDFGLAKMFQTASETAAAPSTVHMLTPGYASPEQVRGEHLTTATDVYSLGVVFYELLTGVSPYRLPSTSPLETYRAICDQEPRPPSAAASSRIPRELDDIALMALRKEPARRYQSVDEFRQDIQRHLDRLPVRATRGTFAYRASKFVRRHRWGVSVSLLGGLAAAAAFGVIWWKGQQAELRFRQVRQLAHSVVFELHDAIQDLPGSTAARKLLIDRALQYLRDLEATGGKNQDLQLELASAYVKVASVQFGPSTANLGDMNGSKDSLQRARRIEHDILRAQPEQDLAQSLLCDTDRRLSDIAEEEGDRHTWQMLRQELAGAQAQLVRRHPDQPSVHAAALWDDAYSLTVVKDHAAAARAWQQALDAHIEASRRQPGDAELRRNVARCHRNLAQSLSQIKRKRDALRHYRDALAIDSARAAADPGNTRARIELSFDLLEIGWLEHEAGNDKEAVAMYQRALAMQRELSAADPNDARARLELAKLQITAAPAYEGAGDSARAIALLLDSAAQFELELQRDPGNKDARIHLGWAHTNLGDIYGRRADWPRAQSSYRQVQRALAPFDGRENFGGLFDPKGMLAHAAKRLAENGQRQGPL
jgi:tetratricopeptide (TPR) repeat protein